MTDDGDMQQQLHAPNNKKTSERKMGQTRINFIPD